MSVRETIWYVALTVQVVGGGFLVWRALAETLESPSLMPTNAIMVLVFVMCVAACVDRVVALRGARAARPGPKPEPKPEPVE